MDLISSHKSHKRVSPCPRDRDPSDTPQKKGKYLGKEITDLPSEIVGKILSHLEPSDVSVCKRVCQSWRKLINEKHMQAVSLYNYCHPMPSTPSLPKPVDGYHSSIRHSLKGFGSEGQTTIAHDGFRECSTKLPKRTHSLAAFHGFSVESKPAIFGDQDFIGSGLFGSVFKAKAIDGREVAIKRSPKDKLEDSYCLAEREKQNLEYISRFNFQYFISYLGGYVQGDHVHFMLELGDVQLEELLKKTIEKINVHSFNNIAFQTMSMIEFLDKIKIRHSDMHFTNMVYFYLTDTIKLVDFERSSFPEDYDYETPFFDLSVLGRHLFGLQLEMKGYSKDEVCDKKVIFSQFSRVDHVLGQSDLWFDDLNQDSKYTIAASIKQGEAKGKEIVGRKECFSPRFRLPQLES